jgi:type II secretory pathway component GspD/PulD (secretin)
MKHKLPALIVGLLTCGLASFAQENQPNPPPPEPAPPPETVVASSPSETVVAAAAAPAPAGAAQPGANEVVPLIVIDEVPLTDAIRNLARQSNLNFQFDPRLTAVGPDGKPTNQPTVSIRFENVTAQEALGAVLDNYDLVLQQDPRSKIARITMRDPKAEDPLFSKIIQLKYADPTNLLSIVKSTLSARSQVMSDPRTSQLIVTTTEKEMDAVMELINRLDTPTKQVLIEAKIVETAHNPSTIKGINWSGTLEAQNFTLGNNSLPGTAATPQTITPGGVVIPAQPATIGGILSGPRVIADTASGGFAFNPAVAFLNADGVNAVFSFFNKDADTEVIATPRAVTLDNQAAQLSVTRAFPIFKITPGSANSPAGAEITYTNLGTILNVTPRIAADNNISLRMVPEVSNIDAVDRQTINGQVNTANIYAIRRMETHVMIPSGNTLVMGGMLNDSSTKGHTKVPLLGDVPGVGFFFRSSNKSRNKQNLLIFVTPTIVQDDDFHLAATGREFLATKDVPRAETRESAWDSAKPHDWTKPVE